MARIVLMIGGIAGALGVAFGAFGAHALADRVSPERMETWEIASRYHLIHAAALVFLALVADRWPGPWTSAAVWMIGLGMLIFSGTLYLLVLTDRGWLGAITPIGGVLLILGWLALAWSARVP